MEASLRAAIRLYLHPIPEWEAAKSGAGLFTNHLFETNLREDPL